MITIFHNPRCSKSREGLKLLQESGEKFEVREYLKEAFSEGEMSNLLEKLQKSPMEIVRTGEKVWKEDYKDKDLSDVELIRVLIAHPSLIQRPIVSTKTKAVVGRPVSEISKILE